MAKIDPRRTTRPRTTCPRCGHEVAVNQAGRLYNHTDTRDGRGHRCIVSGLVPEIYRRNTNQYGATDESEPDPGNAPPDDGLGDPSNNSSTGISGFPQVGPPGPDQSELAQWWREIAEAQITTVVPKANQYGATDLRDLGLQILDMAGRRPLEGDTYGEVDVRYATEVGIAFYAMGKLARVSAAIKEGRAPSYDTWLDLAIYATMALRVHTHGGWPGLPKRITTKKTVHHLLTTDEQIEFAREQAAAYGWDDVTLQRVLDRLRGL